MFANKCVNWSVSICPKFLTWKKLTMKFLKQRNQKTFLWWPHPEQREKNERTFFMFRRFFRNSFSLWNQAFFDLVMSKRKPCDFSLSLFVSFHSSTVNCMTHLWLSQKELRTILKWPRKYQQMCRVSTCCGSIPLETGCYIISIVGIVLGTLSLLAGGLGIVLLGARYDSALCKKKKKLFSISKLQTGYSQNSKCY